MKTEDSYETKFNPLVPVIWLLVILGCGLLGAKGVSNEQINDDIGRQTVKVSGDGTDWIFSGDTVRCFQVVDDQSKITGSEADILVTVAAWREVTTGSFSLYRTVFGRMMLHYKKEGEKWVLENIEPKDLSNKNLETEEFKKYLDITMPVCKYFRHTNY